MGIDCCVRLLNQGMRLEVDIMGIGAVQFTTIASPVVYARLDAFGANQSCGGPSTGGGDTRCS